MKTSELQYRSLIRDELQEVQAYLLHPVPNMPPPLSEAIKELINSGGKRLRPALTILSTYICGADVVQAIPLAAAIEMLHTATLIHDDLIDNARVRRGAKTLNACWSPSTTVLAGDVVFAWAAKLAAQTQNLYLMKRFSETLEVICYGELNQMFYGLGVLPTVTTYYERIYAKTGSLFALTTEAGGILARYSEAQVQQLHRFGMLLGRAFQIVDDILDFMSDEDTLGKPVGSDLRHGLITLPVLHYVQTFPGDTRISQVLQRTATEETYQSLIEDLHHSDAAEWAMTQAQEDVRQALEILYGYPPTPYRHAMEEIAHFSIQRGY
ncbi:MAG: polyprenyl synthetase family protein [Anaerolineae bacterium]|nr:polyprenyl synthetase family protein [Anaerolineae bacterium]